jgi:hypothetical protein
MPAILTAPFRVAQAAMIRRNKTPSRSVTSSAAICSLPSRAFGGGDNLLVAGKFDTDHAHGAGSVAVTGRYSSKTDAFGIDAAYRLDDSSTVYLSYGVSEEKLLGLGMESGFDLFGRKNVVDLAYSPPSDSAAMKLTVRQGKTKLCGYYSFDNFSESNFRNHKSRYELDTTLNDYESLNMTFDQGSRAAKLKVSRKLDRKNRLVAEYNHVTSTKKFVALTLKHALSRVHTISLGANYGNRKYKIEWDCKTANGPWTVTSAFPFNRSPHTGDFSLRRRFEF